MAISKKILFIATVENFFISFHIPFMQYLQGKRYEIHAAAKLGERERRKELEEQNIICHNINFSRSFNPIIALRSLMQLIKLMREEKFSLVHVHTPIAAFLGRLAARLTYSKSVYYIQHIVFIFTKVHFGII